MCQQLFGRPAAAAAMVFLTWVAVTPLTHADGGVTLHNIVPDGVGIDYARTRSPEFATVLAIENQSLSVPVSPAILPVLPQMTAGYPGVAIWDYDGDGDLDLYVSNGPGSANSLFQSQLADSNALTFVDVASSAGVAATDQDSAGVCFGDLDNDGDHDLVVLGRHDENRLYENLGDGTFALVLASGIEGGTLWSSSCALGDVDGDGLLDVFVANTAETADSFWIFVEPFARNQHNQLFANDGGLSFSDISLASGMENLAGLTGGPAPTVTWSAVLADIDLDGDADIVFADDQAAILPALAGGVDRGLIHVLLNDGRGHFSDHPITQTPNRAGPWMGVGLGDLNCDGTLDLYGSNFGDYALGAAGGPPGLLGFYASRWFLGNGDGSFADPGVGALVASPFAWGNAIFDYDNDADLDILAHGGLDLSHGVIADNPGTMLQNQGCTAQFVLDQHVIPEDPSCLGPDLQPIAGCTEHLRRNIRGVAVGDLDRNGFTDVVTVANVVSPEPMPLLPVADVYGSPFDPTARLVPILEGFLLGAGVWSGLNPTEGDLAIELNSGGNGNGWAAVTPRGSVGITPLGRVNRDGIGAVISFTPDGGQGVLSPVTGGSSHLSQHALERVFGLGQTSAGTVEILWPGGVRNRLYEVESGERLLFPEIPCSFDAPWSNRGQYVACVNAALKSLVKSGVLAPSERARFLTSALRAFDEP